MFLELFLRVEISATPQAEPNGGSSLSVPEHVFGSRAFLGNESGVADNQFIVTHRIDPSSSIHDCPHRQSITRRHADPSDFLLLSGSGMHGPDRQSHLASNRVAICRPKGCELRMVDHVVHRL